MSGPRPLAGQDHQDPEPSPALPFPVVGIGASAGGLEALQDLFQGIRSGAGMAFFVIQHLSPEFKSMMVDILGRHTDPAGAAARRRNGSQA